MKNRMITTATLAAAVLLFSGCTGGTDIKESNYEPIRTADGGEYVSPGSGLGTEMTDYSAASSALRIEKTAAGFTVTWKKENSGYSEVIYTDELDKERGNGYPLTSNTKGTFTMPCEMSSEDAYEVRYRCYPSNVTYSKRVKLQKGVEYYWLVSDGVEHQHGEVEASMQYVDGQLVIE